MSTHYSRKFAEDTLVSFQEKYARATEFYRFCFDLTRCEQEDHALHSIAHNQYAWERYKWVIKHIEKTILQTDWLYKKIKNNKKFRYQYFWNLRYMLDEAYLFEKESFKDMDSLI